VTGVRARGMRGRAVRDGLFAAGLVALAFFLFQSWVNGRELPPGGRFGAYDAWIYWNAFRGLSSPDPVLGGPMAYLYSPAFLQVFSFLFVLPFGAFLAGWYLLNAAALVAVVRWWLPAVLLTGVVLLDISRGNIEALMAVAIVAGFRWPGAWAFLLLTKVTPAVGVLWFAGRREWRRLAIALGATAVVAAVSFVLAPSQWSAWIALLASGAGAGSAAGSEWEWVVLPLVVRVPVAALLALVAGRRNWPWLVPVASTLAMPALWPVNLTLLVAVIPLLQAAQSPAARTPGDLLEAGDPRPYGAAPNPAA
jgi:Glycosyltransferase family 87